VLIDGAAARPNGLTLTNDGKTLIVDDTIGPTLFAYDVQPDGTVKNKRAFAQLRDIPAGTESGADGLAIVATSASTSPPSPACRCSTPRASISAPSRPVDRPPTSPSAVAARDALPDRARGPSIEKPADAAWSSQGRLAAWSSVQGEYYRACPPSIFASGGGCRRLPYRLTRCKCPSLSGTAGKYGAGFNLIRVRGHAHQ
jgi:SMP-30/gluconolaconase/LRE-like protein